MAYDRDKCTSLSKTKKEIDSRDSKSCRKRMWVCFTHIVNFEKKTCVEILTSLTLVP